jgi:hypothetical protein
MSNWYGAARTNHVHVEDLDGLKARIDMWPIDISHREDTGAVVFIPHDTDSGDFDYAKVDDEGEDISFDWAVDVMPYIREGEVLIVQSSGAERLRYVTGDAQAYRRIGDDVQSVGISLHDIYTLAAQTFDVDVKNITVAEY